MAFASGHPRLAAVLGANIARHRRESRITRQALADATRISEQDIAAFEAGRERPTATELIRIAGRLGVSLSAMFEDADKTAPAPLSMEEDEPAATPQAADPGDGLRARIEAVGDSRRRHLLMSLAEEFAAENTARAVRPDEVEIGLPGGVTVRVGPEVTREALSRVLAALRDTPPTTRER